MLDLLLAAGFFVAGAGTLAFSVIPVLGGSNQDAPEAWAAIAARVLAATLIALAPVVPAPRILARKRVLLVGIVVLAGALLAVWLLPRGFDTAESARLSGDGARAVELTVATSSWRSSPSPRCSASRFATAPGRGSRQLARTRRDADALRGTALRPDAARLERLHLAGRSAAARLRGAPRRRLASNQLRRVRPRGRGGTRPCGTGRSTTALRSTSSRSRRTRACRVRAPLEQTLPKLKEAAAAAQQEARFAVLALSSASGRRRSTQRRGGTSSSSPPTVRSQSTSRSIRRSCSPPDEQIEVFRIVQEWPANVRKHAGAKRAEVWIGQRLGRRIVSVSDDGVGFDGAEAAAGQGLKNHAAAREDNRRRLQPALAPGARDRTRGRAARLRSAARQPSAQKVQNPAARLRFVR